MIRSRFSHRVRREPQTERFPILRCAICGFGGVPVDMEPGARWGLKAVEITGTVYVGDRADDPVTSFDKQVMTVPRSGECPFCLGEMWIGGRKGSGNRVP